MIDARMNPEAFTPPAPFNNRGITPTVEAAALHQKQWEENIVFRFLEERDIPDTPENRAHYLEKAVDLEMSRQ